MGYAGKQTHLRQATKLVCSALRSVRSAMPSNSARSACMQTGRTPQLPKPQSWPSTVEMPSSAYECLLHAQPDNALLPPRRGRSCCSSGARPIQGSLLLPAGRMHVSPCDQRSAGPRRPVPPCLCAAAPSSLPCQLSPPSRHACWQLPSMQPRRLTTWQPAASCSTAAEIQGSRVLSKLEHPRASTESRHSGCVSDPISTAHQASRCMAWQWPGTGQAPCARTSHVAQPDRDGEMLPPRQPSTAATTRRGT